jgi:hypothetical protein
MKKLILCLLLSLVLTQTPQCEVYERPIPGTQLCEVMCDEHEYWNTLTKLCESCLKGKYFNPNSRRCEKDSLKDESLKVLVEKVLVVLEINLIHKIKINAVMDP